MTMSTTTMTRTSGRFRTSVGVATMTVMTTTTPTTCGLTDRVPYRVHHRNRAGSEPFAGPWAS